MLGLGQWAASGLFKTIHSAVRSSIAHSSEGPPVGTWALLRQAATASDAPPPAKRNGKHGGKRARSDAPDGQAAEEWGSWGHGAGKRGNSWSDEPLHGGKRDQPWRRDGRGGSSPYSSTGGFKRPHQPYPNSGSSSSSSSSSGSAGSSNWSASSERSRSRPPQAQAQRPATAPPTTSVFSRELQAVREDFPRLQSLILQYLDQPHSLSTRELYDAAVAVALCEVRGGRDHWAKAELAEQLLTRLAGTNKEGKPALSAPALAPQAAAGLRPAQQAYLLWGIAKGSRRWTGPLQKAFLAVAGGFAGEVSAAGGARTSPRELSNVGYALGLAFRAWQGQGQGPSQQQQQQQQGVASVSAGGDEARRLLLQLQRDGRLLVRHMNAQDMSNLLLAAAYAGEALDPGFAAEVCARWVQLLQDPGSSGGAFKPQALTNSLWALAKCGEAGTQNARASLLQSAGKAVQAGCLTGSRAQDWSNLMWAVAKLGHYNPGLCAFVAQAVIQRHCMEGATPQAWSNLVWAFATLGHYDGEMMDFAARAATQLNAIQGGTSQDWANLGWAFASLGHYDPGLMDLVAQGIRAQLDRCNPQNLVNALLALAKVYHLGGSRQLADGMVPYIEAWKAHFFSAQDLTNSCWALAVLGNAGHPAMQLLMREACSSSRPACSFTTANLSQLWQAHMELQDLGLASELGSNPDLFAAAQAGWAKQLGEISAASPKVSLTQAQVEAALRRLFPEAQVQREGATRDGLFRVDVMMTWPPAAGSNAGSGSVGSGKQGAGSRATDKGLMVAVEVDGPYHFMVNAPGHCDGSTEIRNRQLARRVTLVVVDAAQEWYHKDQAVQDRMLRAKVQDALERRNRGG